MSKIWLIARHQFRKEAGKKSFLVVLFSLPLFVAFTLGFGYLMSRLDNKTTWLGYVDQAGILVQSEVEAEQDVHLVPFATPEAARAALESGQISAYYVIPPGYSGGGEVELVFFEPPSGAAGRTFRDVVRLNLLAGRSADIVERALTGATLTVQASETGRTYPGGGPEPGQLMPVAVALIFAFLALTTSGYMAEAVVEEKENRTMEIIVTSVSPGRMMNGKIVGALGIAGLQLAIWIVFLAAAFWLGQLLFDSEWLRQFTLEWRDLGLILLVALPSYVFLAAAMTAIGASIVENQEAHQVGPLFFLVIFMPTWLLIPIANNPDGPLALIFSLIPGPSVVTLAIRNVFTQVPAWQYGAATAIAAMCAVAMMWAAGRAFRISMLRYGRRLHWRELFGSRQLSPEVGDLHEAKRLTKMYENRGHPGDQSISVGERHE
jgi:ABC-2 type transport system permease protein